MIQLSRTRTAAAIPVSFRGPGRLKNARALIKLIRSGKAPKASVWKRAKVHLRADTFDKCAYCESSTATVAHGDVEHFRPKTTYWWLAYCLDNYTFSCQICNQSYKGSSFPYAGTDLAAPAFAEPFTNADLETLAETLGPDPLDDLAVGRHNAALTKQKAHLPDPYAVDPEPLFAWFADPVLKEVEVRPGRPGVTAKRAHEAVVQYLGLNRDELKRRRYQVYNAAKTLADLLVIPGLPPDAANIAKTQLKEMMLPSSEYAGMVRYFVRAQWQGTGL